VGGYAGGWVAASELGGLALSDEHLAAHEAALGSGIVLLLSERACPVAETARLARWMAEQSARQCGPCVHGLDAIAATVLGVARGEGGPAPGRRLDRLTALTARRGACRHPDGAVRVLLSALRTFRGDFAEHARSGPCERCANASELALPDRPVSERTLRAKGWAA
jgi:NADH:ubiquinone oxidoreductase subunit F (NADH-binding)